MARKVYRKAKRRRATGAAQQTGYKRQKTKLDTSIMTLNGRNVKIPTFDDLLAVSPLPPEFAGLEPALRNSPVFANMIAVATGCIEHGMDTAGALDALLCGALDNGKFTMLAFCRRCEQLINENRATPAMRRNLRAYGGVQ